MVTSHSFLLEDKIEEQWKKYEEKYSAIFTKVANKALREFFKKNL